MAWDFVPKSLWTHDLHAIKQPWVFTSGVELSEYLAVAGEWGVQVGPGLKIGGGLDLVDDSILGCDFHFYGSVDVQDGGWIVVAVVRIFPGVNLGLVTEAVAVCIGFNI